MTFPQFLQGSWLVGAGLLLTACDDGLEVRFAQPFPAQGTDMTVFPARNRAVYTATDSSKSLCIGRTAVWRQELETQLLSRQQFELANHRRLRADSAYEQDGHLHSLRLIGRDSVRDSWLWTDTIFTLAGPQAGKLRRFQGRYYLNIPTDSDDKWRVERLEIDGWRVSWQTFGKDTLRLLALEPTAVRYHRQNGALTSFQLTPAPGAQTRRVGRYAGLWETEEEYRRRR
ncbi:MAG: hypothetical protein JWP58_4408 [Hymenobacter sp.]|nr:hypothetical protein [Hymenobacter sp.]